MRLSGIIWLRDIVDKIAFKHGLQIYEVEEVLRNKPRIRFVEKGEQKGEDVYKATGQTDSGRCVLVVFLYKKTKEALILSARDMTDKERKRHGKK